MTNAEIPAAVLQFIAKRIDTVPELETLLIMSAQEGRAWSVEDIAARTYVSRELAYVVLTALHRRQLVSADAAEQNFRFSPANEDERLVILQTANAYRHNLISIATFIHKKAASSVQEFARAFDFKKEK